MEEKKYCGLTLEEVRAMKSKYGKIFIVEIEEELSKEKFTAICKEPTMEILQAITTASGGDDLKASKLVFDNCVVVCDEPIRERFVLKAKVAATVTEQLNKFKAEVKNV
jgi:hypothetical protein